MVNRLVSADENHNVPDNLKIRDVNLPARLQDTALNATYGPDAPGIQAAIDEQIADALAGLPVPTVDYFTGTFAPPAGGDTPSVSITTTAPVGTLTRELRTAPSGPADLANDPAFRYDGMLSLPADPSNAAAFVRTSDLPGGTGQGAQYQLRIETYTPAVAQVAYKVRAGLNAISLRFSVGGRWITQEATRFTGLTAGATYYIVLTFPTARSRRVTLEYGGSGMSFGGMIAASGAFTRPAEPVRRKLAVLGDSYTGGSGLAPDGALRFETWANFVAKLLGADSFINFGIGGTGWITDGSGTTKFSGRTADILAYNPDILLILGSRNDSYDNAALTTAVTNLLNSFASIKQVYVSGPSTSPFSNRNTSIKAATVAVGRPFLDGIAGAWITEADLGPDGVHPTFNGHKKIARAYYEAILANPDVSGGTVPPGPTVIFSDDFERPDGNLYGSTTPTGGYTWAAAGTDTATISGGAVAMTATTEQFAFVMAGTNTNGRLSATMTAGARGELLMRYQNVSNYLWLDGNTASPYKYRLRQRIANVTTDIATLEAVPAPGDQIVVDLNGTTATVTINGTQLFNGTVPTISGGYGYGFIAYPSTVSQRWGSISLTALP